MTLLTILVHYNSPAECIRLISQLININIPDHYIIVVDNQSSPHQYATLQHSLKDLRCDLIQNKLNGGYGSGMNAGVKYGQKYNPDYIQILNTDVSISNPQYIHELLKILDAHPTIGAIGPCVKYKDGSIQNTILPQVSIKSALFYRKSIKQRSFTESQPATYPVDVINGVCLLVRNKVFKSIHGFDEHFFMYGEENDLCYRIHLTGLSIHFWSGNSLVHYEDHKQHTNKELTWRDLIIRANQVLFLKKHKSPLSALILSLFFTLNIIIKVMFGYKLEVFSLLKATQYMFQPLLLNQRMVKGK